MPGGVLYVQWLTAEVLFMFSPSVRLNGRFLINNNQLFMVPHLVRAWNAYKDKDLSLIHI